MMKPLPDMSEQCPFLLKPSDDSTTGIFHNPFSYNINLEQFRSDLLLLYNIPLDRRIFYIDEDHDKIPIDSECEFQEVLQFAKNTLNIEKPLKKIQLIVGSCHLNVSFDDESFIDLSLRKTLENDLKELSNGEPKGDIDNYLASRILHPELTAKNVSHIKRVSIVKSPLLKTRDKYKWMDITSNEKNSNDMESRKELDASLALHSDTPPSWFTDYMESIKKDMISTISQEVTKHVTEMLNKHFDISASSSSKNLEHQSNDFSPRRHSEYYSSDKKQMKMMQQDEEQSSDASIERVDEPQDSVLEHLRGKNDVHSTTRHKSLTKMMKLTYKKRGRPVNIPLKEFCERHSQFPFTKVPRYSFDSLLSKENQEKIKARDAEQLSDDTLNEHMDESQNINAKIRGRRVLQKLDLLQDAISDYSNMKEKKKKRKHHQLIAETNTNMSDDVCKTQQLSNSKLNNCPTKKNEIEPQKDLPLQDPNSYDERIHLETLKMLENELRMNCSITGHQMLDEDRRNKNIGSCNDLHIDHSSVYDSSEMDDAFEFIQMPVSNANERPEESIAEQHCSSRDSPSFELLSELSSPNDDLVTNKEAEEIPESQERSDSTEKEPESEERIDQQLEQPKLTLVVDANGKVHGHYNNYKLHYKDIAKEAIFYDKDTTKNPSVRDTRYSEVSHDGTSSSYGDVRNSHPSYMPVNQCMMPHLHCTCSETDLIDFMQSFHSHTTSVTTDTTEATDTAEIYADACDNEKYGESLTSRNVQEMGATATEMHATKNVQESCQRKAKDVPETEPVTTTTAENDFAGNDWPKEAKTNEKYRYEANGSSRTYSFPAPDASQQSRRANGSADKPASNDKWQRKSNEPFGAGDPVHILPETLVTAAAQVGTYALVTARDFIDKMRQHTKEDAARRKDKARQ